MSTRYGSPIPGFDPKTHALFTDLDSQACEFILCEANGAIAIGSPVSVDIAAGTRDDNNLGKLVIETDSDNNGAISLMGIYTGKLASPITPGRTPTSLTGTNDAGSAADTTYILLTGYAAADGDLIWVQNYGPSAAIVNNQGNAITIGTPLIASTTAGQLIEGTQALVTTTDGAHALAGHAFQVQALQTTTTGIAGEVGLSVFVRCK